MALCHSCEVRPAIKDYTRAGRTEMVCARCFDVSITHDALDDRLLEIFALEESGRTDDALALLDAIQEANRHRDHDGWLANSVALHRTSILNDVGRYAEAEQAFKEWAKIGFIDLWRRQMYALGLTDTLVAMGRDAEAIEVLESALGKEEPHDLRLALTVLTELIRISENVGVPFNLKWLPIAEAVAAHEGVEMPSAPSPTAAILALHATLHARAMEEQAK